VAVCCRRLRLRMVDADLWDVLGLPRVDSAVLHGDDSPEGDLLCREEVGEKKEEEKE